MALEGIMKIFGLGSSDPRTYGLTKERKKSRKKSNAAAPAIKKGPYGMTAKDRNRPKMLMAAR